MHNREEGPWARHGARDKARDLLHTLQGSSKGMGMLL